MYSCMLASCRGPETEQRAWEFADAPQQFFAMQSFGPKFGQSSPRSVVAFLSTLGCTAQDLTTNLQQRHVLPLKIV